MPGLCAIVGDSGTRPPAVQLRAMLQRMMHFDSFTRVEYVDRAQPVALGRVALPWADDGSPAISEDRQLVVVLDGELYDVGAERARLSAAGCRFTANTDAELILHGWKHEGAAFLARLHGSFTAAMWDSSKRQLTVLNDRFGLRPLYLAQVAGRLLVSSEIKALLADPALRRTWSLAGVAEFFTFGYFLNDDTLFENVRALPPAGCATYNVADGHLHIEPYWRAQPNVVGGSSADRAQALESAFVNAVARRVTPAERLGLSLSGGMDARTILGVMPPAIGNLTSVSIGVEGSIDHRCASRLAALAGVPHHCHVLDDRFLNDFERHLRLMVLLTDGHYLDQGIVVPTLPTYRDLGIEVLLRGHGGELLHMDKAYAFSVDEEALTASEASLERWLYAHLSDYMLDGVPPGVFAGELEQAIPALGRESLQTSIGAASMFDSPQQRIWHLFLTQRLHRETAASMQKFGCYADVRLPFIDNDVLDVVFSLPPREKLGDALLVNILRHHCPEFLQVVNSNTGTTPASGSVRTSVAKLRLRAYSKLGVRGYQPYERLGLWLSQELRGFVERTLLSDELFGRGLFNADEIRRLVQRHMDRQANHTFFLMALLIFELGQQMLAGPEAFVRDIGPLSTHAVSAP